MGHADAPIMLGSVTICDDHSSTQYHHPYCCPLGPLQQWHSTSSVFALSWLITCSTNTDSTRQTTPIMCTSPISPHSFLLLSNSIVVWWTFLFVVLFVVYVLSDLMILGSANGPMMSHCVVVTFFFFGGGVSHWLLYQSFAQSLGSHIIWLPALLPTHTTSVYLYSVTMGTSAHESHLDRGSRHIF